MDQKKNTETKTNKRNAEIEKIVVKSKGHISC